ncbi:hypothetical protein HZS_5192, partial [Henneguya salminicola]
MSYYNKSGRKLTDNRDLINSIKDVITIDNSYTQVGIKTQLENINFSISRSKNFKVMKQADITQKRLKKKASITLSQDHQQTRSRYALLFLSKRGRTFLFLDASGFNLHTSINYGYSNKNIDAISFVPPNRGRNVSTCCVISATRLENFEVIIGPFNKERFQTFLLKCFNERTFTGRPIVVNDNVRFHKSRKALNFFDSRDIEYIIRPKPQTTPDLVITLANLLGTIQRENTIE